MTTTDLITILKHVEKGASGRSREISIYNKKGKRILSDKQMLDILSCGDGCAGAELSLVIKSNV